MSYKSKLLLSFIIIMLLILFGGIILIYNGGSDIAKDSITTFNVDKIIQHAESGKQQLQEAQKLLLDGKYSESSLVLKSAIEDFDNSMAKVKSLDVIQSRFIPLSPINSALQTLKAAREGAVALQYMNHIMWTLTSEHDIGKALISLENIMISMQKIEDDLDSVNTLFFPSSISSKIDEIQTMLSNYVTYREIYLKYIDSFYEFVGMDNAKTYAVALQNTAEARATGGFIGSIVVFTIQKGKVVSWDILDTHLLDFQGGSFQPAPEYYNYISRIALQEANYTPDIRISGERMRYFLEEQGGPTVSAIIFIDDSILPFLLDIIDGAYIEGVEEKVTSENYFEIIQFEMEQNNVLRKERVKNPKEEFFKLVEGIQKEIMKLKPNQEHLNKIMEFIEQKHIQIYTPSEDLQNFLDEVGFLGYFTDNGDNDDFLSIIHSTFFNKSNRFMEDNLNHTTNISPNGQVIDEITIKRKHNYNHDISTLIENNIDLKDLNDVQKNELINVLGGGDNLDIVRVYVPKDSVLLETTGMKIENVFIGEELNKTFFSFRMETRATEENIVSLKYKLPFTINDPEDYNLYISKQSGIDNTNIHKQLIFNKSSDILPLQAEIDSDLTTDLIINTYISNSFLWNNKELTMKKTKNRSISKLKMKIEQAFTPML